MQLLTHINEEEIRTAIAQYVSRELDVPLGLVSVNIEMHTFSGNDPREHNHVTATAKYTKR